MQYLDPKGSAKDAPGPMPAAKLYSIAGQMRGREFAGEFTTKGGKYQFTFSPTAAALNQGKLELTGTFTVSAARAERGQKLPPVTNVRATLASTQGGIGQTPERRQLLAGTAQTSQTATPEQKQTQAGETTKPAPESAPPSASRLPETESTGSRGFVAALYFRLSPLDGRALGVPLDLGRVQLNARLYPTSDLERDLQWLFSALVEAVYGEPRDERAAAEYLAQVNRLLKS